MAYTFFYKTSHPFSNWHPSKFVAEDGKEYICSEQWMMAEKARIFGDEETRAKILASTDPREHKVLGREVKNFVPSEWTAISRDVVYQGLKMKFSQNPSMKQVLLDTEGTDIVEAAADDRIWGIGLGEDDPLIHDPNNWNGLNWLGETLTKLREDFICGKI